MDTALAAHSGAVRRNLLTDRNAQDRESVGGSDLSVARVVADGAGAFSRSDRSAEREQGVARTDLPVVVRITAQKPGERRCRAGGGRRALGDHAGVCFLVAERCAFVAAVAGRARIAGVHGALATGAGVEAVAEQAVVARRGVGRMRARRRFAVADVVGAAVAVVRAARGR
jgi:hypothetical protein